MNLITSLLCAGSLPAEIQDIIDAVCQDFGQIQKFFVQRTQSGGVDNSFTIATNNPNIKASWSPLFTAADSTKVTRTPYIENPEVTPGDKKEFGSGNEVLNGIPIPTGSEATTVTSVIRRTRQDVIEALKSYRDDTISLYFINQNGWIAGVSDDVASPTTFKGFPIYGLHVGDLGIGGLEDPDSNAFEFSLAENWSDKFTIIQPSGWNPLTDTLS